MAETKTTKKTTKKADKDSSKAVIFTGGKQYLVGAGDVLNIEKIPGDQKEGDKITFDKVLMVSNGNDVKVGTPEVAGAKVTATIKKIGRAPKVTVIHYKPKSRYFKKAGHRQPFFQVEIEKIS